ncbi:MAG: single-stranded DNA-binding protein [Oscillospiraceae bacterium]|nr:single-stranded DNA-binding protein [Oscillospiraceae bacterium]
MNKVILMGRLTQDPELRQSQSGVNSCRFTVAIDRPMSAAAQQNGSERQTDFISCTAFNKTAEFVSRYFNKGRLILVEGTLRTGSYNDRNHPEVKHYTTDVWVDNVSFGETKASSGGGYNGQNAYGQGGGGYQSQGYQSNNGYAGGGYSAPQQNYAPQQPMQAAQPAPSVSVGELGDFEDIISDSDLPF